MLLSIWLFVLFFLIWIGYDVYLAVSDVKVFGPSWYIWPHVARATIGFALLVLFLLGTLS